MESINKWLENNIKYLDNDQMDTNCSLIYESDKESDIMSLSIESSRSSTDSSTDSSNVNGFSYIPLQDAFKYLGFGLMGFSKFLFTQTDDETLIVSSVLEAPDSVKKSTFKSLNQSMSCFPFPSFDAGERNSYFILSSFLGSTVVEFNKSEMIFRINFREKFTIDSEELVNSPFSGYTDICIVDQKSYSDKIVIVVGISTESVEQAFKKTMLCLKAAYLKNNDGRYVYGISTNALDMSIQKFDGVNFTTLFKIPFLCPMMRERSFEDKWLANYSRSVDLIYSILNLYV